MKAHMMQAEDPRQDTAEACSRSAEPGATWLYIVQNPPPPIAAALASVEAGAPLSEAHWHLMFNAVKARLQNAAAHPETLAVVVPECVEALQWLQDNLDPRRFPAR